jgi:hypothetical protein
MQNEKIAAKNLAALQHRVKVWSRQIHGNHDIKNRQYDATVLSVSPQPAGYFRIITASGTVYCRGDTMFELATEATTLDDLAVAMPRKVARVPGRRSVD